ncbi:hypothetical protein C9374_002591 [Naegleria lovaniensis]|uniref:Uncharacterized protein n=1 Tax=Naegleria lovaniensis TaxID=51637 RepID=A0AA88GSP0_NAELO|nr:uncharacterized protein C9374_002591 [Naegleria lovaniensis]KAG2386145.1 hypothetical protein C9374_002591 [Naegleria lovaniensis]
MSSIGAITSHATSTRNERDSKAGHQQQQHQRTQNENSSTRPASALVSSMRDVKTRSRGSSNVTFKEGHEVLEGPPATTTATRNNSANMNSSNGAANNAARNQGTPSPQQQQGVPSSSNASSMMPQHSLISSHSSRQMQHHGVEQPTGSSNRSRLDIISDVGGTQMNLENTPKVAHPLIPTLHEQQQSKVNSEPKSPLLGGPLIEFDELLEFVKKIVSVSEALKDSKLKKNGNVIHIRLLHIEDEVTHWGRDLIKQSNDKQIGKALQLLYQQLTKVYTLLSKIQRCKWFVDIRFSKKAKKLTEELDNVTTVLGVSITYFKAQTAYSNVHKLGIVSGYPDIDIFDLDDKNNLALAADRFYMGHGVTQNFEMAYRLYLHAARLEEARSQYIVGSMLIDGVGVEKDSRLGVKWILKSASQDYPDALNQMGIFYETGFIVEQNFETAAKFYLRSSHMAHLDGMTNYAALLLQGKGVEKNQKKAAWLLKKACERNYAKAQNELGVMYYKGLGVEEAPDKAVELFTQSADKGNVYALNNLGIAYEEGKGVVRDYAKATICYEKSARLGNINGLNNLGYIKLLQKQYDQALDLLHEASDRGSVDAMYNIGNMYRLGLGVTADITIAFKFFYRAATLGHVKSQRIVADVLYSGKYEPIPANKKEAASFYYKAALNGDAESCNNLGILYEDGCEGLHRDEQKAIEWFRRGSELGSDNAMYNLATILERRNQQEQATALLRRASSMGNTKARERIGVVLE